MGLDITTSYNKTQTDREKEVSVCSYVLILYDVAMALTDITETDDKIELCSLTLPDHHFYSDSTSNCYIKNVS